jgi:PII-like signaling protein
MKVEFVETAEKVAALLPKLQEMAGNGLIAVSEVEVIK